MKSFVLGVVSLCLAVALSITGLSYGACDGDSVCQEGNGVTTGCYYDYATSSPSEGGCNKDPAKCDTCSCQLNTKGGTDTICREEAPSP